MNHQGTRAPSIPIPAATDRVAKQIVDEAFTVHSTLGPGLLESEYETCLVHEAQVLTYLKLSGHRLGFLINFNVPVFKQGIKRLAS